MACELHVVIFTLWNLPSDGDHLWLAGIEHKAIAAVASKKWCYYRVNFAGEPASLPDFLGSGWKTQKNSEALLVGVMAT